MEVVSAEMEKGCMPRIAQFEAEKVSNYFSVLNL